MLKFDPSANKTWIVFAVNKQKFLKIMYALKLIFYLTPSFSSQLLARLTATATLVVSVLHGGASQH